MTFETFDQSDEETWPDNFLGKKEYPEKKLFPEKKGFPEKIWISWKKNEFLDREKMNLSVEKKMDFPRKKRISWEEENWISQEKNIPREKSGFPEEK